VGDLGLSETINLILNLNRSNIQTFFYKQNVPRKNFPGTLPYLACNDNFSKPNIQKSPDINTKGFAMSNY